MEEKEAIITLEKKIEDFFRKVQRYRWLQRVSSEYEAHIDLIKRELDYYTVYGIVYAARGDTRTFDVNPHMSIDPKYILDGMTDALKRVNDELEQVEKELNEII